MDGKIIHMANPANDTQIQTPPSYMAYDEKNNPTNDKINKVQYIVIILTGLQNLTRIIPILFLSKHIKNSQYTAYRDVVIEIKSDEEEQEDEDQLSLLESENVAKDIQKNDLENLKRSNIKIMLL
jgi:ribosomal protein S3AE